METYNGTGEIESGLSQLHVEGIQTKPGAPLGDIVFDHPPSAVEKREARESIDAKRE